MYALKRPMKLPGTTTTFRDDVIDLLAVSEMSDLKGLFLIVLLVFLATFVVGMTVYLEVMIWAYLCPG